MFNLFGKRSRRIYNSNGLVLCSSCGEYLPESEFYSGRNQCKTCYKHRVNNRLEQRVKDALKAQKERAGYLTREDDFTVSDLEQLIIEQGNRCAACGEEFESIQDFEIAHIVSVENGGHCTKSNLQLVLPEYNARGKAGTKNIMYMRTNMKINNRMNVDW